MFELTVAGLREVGWFGDGILLDPFWCHLITRPIHQTSYKLLSFVTPTNRADIGFQDVPLWSCNEVPGLEVRNQ